MISNCNRAAFTLIEVLITMLILSIGIVGILYAFDESMTALSKIRCSMFSTVLCRDKLTDIESDIVADKAPEAASGGVFTGMYENYRWGMESSLVPHNMNKESSANTAGEDEDREVTLYKVKVFVWQDGYPDVRQEAVTYFRL